MQIMTKDEYHKMDESCQLVHIPMIVCHRSDQTMPL